MYVIIKCFYNLSLIGNSMPEIPLLFIGLYTTKISK